MPRAPRSTSLKRFRPHHALNAVLFLVTLAVFPFVFREFCTASRHLHMSLFETDSFLAYCEWKAKVESSVDTDVALKRALQVKRSIYVGAADKRWFGWESYGKKQLDVTSRADFVSQFCPGEIQAFLSEHTFEHIPLDASKKAFKLFFEFLTPGGHVRIAIPSFPTGHKGSAVDKEYGHVNFLSAKQLVALLEHSGFVDVHALEWVDFEAGTVHTKYWNVCEGPVKRSVPFDERNQQFLSANCHTLNRTRGTKAPDLNSLLSSNVFSVHEVRTRSTIVQGQKPRLSSKEN